MSHLWCCSVKFVLELLFPFVRAYNTHIRKVRKISSTISTNKLYEEEGNKKNASKYYYYEKYWIWTFLLLSFSLEIFNTWRLCWMHWIIKCLHFFMLCKYTHTSTNVYKIFYPYKVFFVSTLTTPTVVRLLRPLALLNICLSVSSSVFYSRRWWRFTIFTKLFSFATLFIRSSLLYMVLGMENANLNQGFKVQK